MLLLVAACGDNEVPQDVVHSGSRLRAMYLTDVEGDRIFRGWFDRELGVECQWTGGAEPRCLPDRIDTTVFDDPACTDPLAMVAPSDPPDPCAPPAPAYVGVRRDPCAWDAVDEVWALTTVTAQPSTVYRWNVDTGECIEGAPDPTYVYYRAGERIPLDHFVGGDPVDIGRGRIRTRTIVAEDGALVPLGAYDAELDASCHVDRERGCLPEASSVRYAENDTCMQPIVTAPTACDPPPYLAMSQTDPTSYFKRGEAWTSDPTEILDLWDMSIIILGQGWSCSPVQATVIDGYTLYHAGARVADASFEPVFEARGAGARIQPMLLGAANHREVVGYHDVQIDLPCSPTEVATGAWRCVPSLHGIWTRFFFADAACVQPIEVLFHYDPEPPGLPGLRYEQVGACGFRYRAHAPGTLLPLGTYFASFDGTTCEAYDPGDPGVTAYTVGPEVPLDPYAELQRITE